MGVRAGRTAWIVEPGITAAYVLSHPVSPYGDTYRAAGGGIAFSMAVLDTRLVGGPLRGDLGPFAAAEAAWARVGLRSGVQTTSLVMTPSAGLRGELGLVGRESGLRLELGAGWTSGALLPVGRLELVIHLRRGRAR